MANREDILRAFRANLATRIDGNAPYVNDIAGRVSRVFEEGKDAHVGERPSIVLGVTTPGQHTPLLTNRKITTLDIIVWGYFKKGQALSDFTQQEAAHSLLEDITRAVNADIQLGGLVIQVFPVADDVAQGKQNMENTGAARSLFRVKYENSLAVA